PMPSPAPNKNGYATDGRGGGAADRPVCNGAMVTTGVIITTLGLVSRTALLAGATGLVGSHVLNLLLGDPAWSRVVTVGRRTTPQQHAKLEQRVLDLGERREFRLGERIAMLGAPVLSVALFGRLRRYRPI